VCHMPCPSYSHSSDHHNNTWWRLKILKLLIIQFSIGSCHLWIYSHKTKQFGRKIHITAIFFKNMSPLKRGISMPSVANTVGADKSLAWPGRKQATATDDIDVHISYL
jgi:hypothetical protein